MIYGMRPGQLAALALWLVLLCVFIALMRIGIQWTISLIPGSIITFLGAWFILLFVWRVEPLSFRISASGLSAACLWLLLFILAPHHTQEINCQPGPDGAMKWECLSDTPPPQPSDWDVVDRKPLR
jgi:hypothetical protein